MKLIGGLSNRHSSTDLRAAMLHLVIIDECEQPLNGRHSRLGLTPPVQIYGYFAQYLIGLTKFTNRTFMGFVLLGRFAQNSGSLSGLCGIIFLFGSIGLCLCIHF